MISVKENIRKLKDDMLRIEGRLNVFLELENAGVENIYIGKNPLESTEVIDGNDVRGGNEQKTENAKVVQ